MLICQTAEVVPGQRKVGNPYSIEQCFPTFLGLRHPTEKNNNLWHP